MDRHRWEQIQATFDQLVELAPSDRGARLATLGSTDPALRAAVESMLAADAAADVELAPLDTAFLSPSATTPDLFGLSGRSVSHFLVREPLGAGGMGVVYRAHDTRLGRPVALKFLLPLYQLDTAAKARFIREAKSGAALDHPNLCAIYEVGTTDDGQLFLAMPLYAGETLKARLEREGALSVSNALAITRQVAAGLASAHQAGIVHRDLKPGNVMLLGDGGVRILDFGLAKARDQSVTKTGARFGTVSYMAPEQVHGGAVDGRTDLWAVGVLLYEMLTGRRPFGGDEEIAVAHAIIHDEPVPVGALRSEVHAGLEDVVIRLLQKDPAARYASADALLSDLVAAEKTVGGFTQSLRRGWRRARHQLLAKRRWVAAAAASLAVAAIAYAAAGTGETPPVAPARTTIAILPFQNLSPDGPHAYFAAGLHDEIMTQLYRVTAIKVIGRASVMHYGGANLPPPRQVASELGVGTIVQGSVQVVGNRVRVNVQLLDPTVDAPLWVQQYDRTLEDVFALESDIAQQIAATVGAALSSAERQSFRAAPTTMAEAYLLFLQGREYERRPNWALENFEAAERLYERAIALDSSFALAHAALAGVHGSMYWMRFDMTPTRLARMREEAETAVRLAPELADARIAMGHAYVVGSVDHRAALNQYLIGSRANPNNAQLWRWLAQAHRQLGEWDEFAVAFRRAVELDPRDAVLLWDQGANTHLRMGRYAEAIQWYERAFSIAPDQAWIPTAKAWVYVWWQGQLDSLRADVRQHVAAAGLGHAWSYVHIKLLRLEQHADSVLLILPLMRSDIFADGTTFEPKSLWAGWAYELQRDSIAARRSFGAALATLDSALAKFPDDWPVHRSRGLALAGLGRREAGLAEVRWLQACPICRNDQFLRPNVEEGVGHILAQLGDADAALDVVERLLAERPPALSIHALRLDPLWDPIREHPRFRALIAKYVS